MKYAIYDKAANGYLTEMDFDIVLSNDTKFRCALTEYITNAKLLDTKEAAIDVVTRIEGFKFMEKGRFVSHSFDDTLNNQYIISEAGNPTKVVDNITVDLDGTVNVKYGTMISHWSTVSLSNAVYKLDRLQKAVSQIYGPWRSTFDIYKVITIMDEKENTHYQFVKVTEKCLDFAKEEENPLNKRIEELEKANYELGEQVAERGIVANSLLDENNSLKTKVEAIKKEAHDWKKLYENALDDQKKLNDANKATISYLTINKMAKDKELSDAADSLKEANDKNEGLTNIIKEIADCVIDIMVATRSTDTDKMISNLTDVSLKMGVKTTDDGPIHGILVILNTLIRIVKEKNDWKRRAEEAIRDYTKYNEALGEWKRKCKAKDTDYEMLKNKLKACEIVLESTQSSLTLVTKERDKALEQKEFYKRQANSVYGMTIPSRCCGKQLTADILSGKKIPISKKKYDDLVEYVNNINLTYDNIFCMMDKPVYLSTITESLNDLTK